MPSLTSSLAAFEIPLSAITRRILWRNFSFFWPARVRRSAFTFFFRESDHSVFHACSFHAVALPRHTFSTCLLALRPPTLLSNVLVGSGWTHCPHGKKLKRTPQSKKIWYSRWQTRRFLPPSDHLAQGYISGARSCTWRSTAARKTALNAFFKSNCSNPKRGS